MLIIFYYLLFCLFTFIALKELRKENYQITPLIFFVALVIIDVIIPALLFQSFGLPNYPQYYGIITNLDLFKSVLIFLVGTFFFYIGYKAKIIKVFKEKTYTEQELKLNYRLLYFLYVVVVMFIFLNIIIEIKNLGGFHNYYTFKIRRVYLEAVQNQNAIEKIIALISSKSSSLLIIFTNILFYNRHTYNKRVLWGIIVPTITFLIISTSLYRGTILVFFISLMVVDIFRVHEKGKVFNIPINSIIKKNMGNLLKFSFISVFIFLFYGTIRGKWNNASWGTEVSFIESFLLQVKNILGVSLMALTRVINHFTDSSQILFGKTIIEMFYFFIPRSIYPDKPVQYGIITATKSMGSPSTTMDAITMPGEMIANFGIFGVVLVFFFGYFYKNFKFLTYNVKYISIYATLLTSITASFWMSFTGLFSQMVYLPIYIFIVNLLYKKQTKHYKI